MPRHTECACYFHRLAKRRPAFDSGAAPCSRHTPCAVRRCHGTRSVPATFIRERAVDLPLARDPGRETDRADGTPGDDVGPPSAAQPGEGTAASDERLTVPRAER